MACVNFLIKYPSSVFYLCISRESTVKYIFFLHFIFSLPEYFEVFDYFVYLGLSSFSLYVVLVWNIPIIGLETKTRPVGIRGKFMLKKKKDTTKYNYREGAKGGTVI